MRKRKCDHPAPVASGKYCPGLGIKYVGICNKTTTVIITTVTASPRYDLWLTVSGALAGIVSTIVTIALVLAFCTWCKCCAWYECLRKGCAWMVFDPDSDKSDEREENAMAEVLVASNDGSGEDSEDDF